MDISDGYVAWISLDIYGCHFDIFSGYLFLDMSEKTSYLPKDIQEISKRYPRDIQQYPKISNDIQQNPNGANSQMPVPVPDDPCPHTRQGPRSTAPP